MKSAVVVFLGWALIMCSLFEAEADCNLNGELVKTGEHIRDCIKFTCHEAGSLSAVGCALVQCKKQIGYQETDLSKPYPECCARPICDTN